MAEDNMKETLELPKVSPITTKRYRKEGGVVHESEPAKKIEPETGQSGEKTHEPFAPSSTIIYERSFSSKPRR